MSVKSAEIKSKPWITYLVIFFAAFIFYANTISHDYAWDDKIVIEKNPRVQKGISGIPDLFVKHNSDFQYDKYGYRPITLSSFAIDYSISKGNPHFSHFMNVFYFAVLSLLIFALLSSLFPSYHTMIPLLITLLFMAHPLHVEVVANIKSRDEIFGLLFSVASLIYFLKFLVAHTWKFLFPCMFCYLLAYFSKENSITLLGIYPLLFIIYRTGFTKKNGLVYAAMALLLFLISFIFYRYTETSMAGIAESQGLGFYNESGILGNSFLMVGSIGQKIANAFFILLLYLKNFLVPYPLIYYYGYNVVPATSWANPWVWFSVGIHISIIVIGIKHVKSRPEILFGFLFYLISISVFTHVLRPLSDTMADRFMFAASLGLCICLVGLLNLLFKISSQTIIRVKDFFKSNKIYAGILTLLISIFTVLTINRNRVWKDDLTLVKNDMPFLENCSRAHYYYATLIKKQLTENKSLGNGNPKRLKLEEEMIDHYEKSMQISDAAYRSYLELGSYYTSMQKWNKAIPLLQKGVQLFPDAADLNFCLGQAYVNLYQNELAIPYLEKSKSIAYNQPKNYYMLSLAYSRSNRLTDAVYTAKEGLKKFEKDQVMFYDALGFIYFEHDSLDRSIEYTLKMKDQGKPEKEVYGYIIQRCYQKGDTTKGNKYLQEARLKGIVFN
jgi:tetratricopeptide (TPR) repeat protein